MKEQEAIRKPDWPICGVGNCIGVRVDRNEACLAHVGFEVRNAILTALKPSADLDLRGTPIDRELLRQLLGAMQLEDGPPTLGDAQFGRAHFTGDVRFDRVRFTGEASFEGTQFRGDVRFAQAVFTGNTIFARAQFAGDVGFPGARFNGYAVFQSACFAGIAAFNRARFTEDALFYEAQFTEEAWFDHTLFAEDAVFAGAQFKRARAFGPVVAGLLNFDQATFEQGITIEAVGARLSCRGTQFTQAATLRLRRCDVVLDSAMFAKPSTVAFAPGLFVIINSGLGREVELFGEVADAQLDIGRRARPRLLSLRGVDAATLTLSELDLAACLFQGAHHLDQLRIEGARPFADTPGTWRLHFGRWSVPVWQRWSRRQTLAEEHHWRAAPSRGAAQWTWLTRPAWHSPACETPRWVTTWRAQAQQLTPDRLAMLYRALRKAQEDSKNEPGAADFYFGEMEMRRQDRHTPWAERIILWLYWLVSGYGLRGLRALAWLVIVIVGLAVLLQAIGFEGGDPAFRDALIYATQSTLSIASGNRALTEHVSWSGEVLRIALRLAGPLLLGLALLSIRNRVKR